jgi:hypothetical protein
MPGFDEFKTKEEVQKQLDDQAEWRGSEKVIAFLEFEGLDAEAVNAVGILCNAAVTETDDFFDEFLLKIFNSGRDFEKAESTSIKAT